MEPSLERDNVVKLSYILVEVVGRNLREYFVKLWNQKYPNEKWHGDAAKRDNMLKTLLVTRGGTLKQDIYSQKILKGNEQEWDIATSIKAILDSGFNLIDGCRSSDQRSIPLRESEELEIIRGIRNTWYGHLTSTKCSFADFKDIMTSIKSVAKNLFGDAVELEIYVVEVSPTTPTMRDQLELLKGNLVALFIQFTRKLANKISY